MALTVALFACLIEQAARHCVVLGDLGDTIQSGSVESSG